MRLKKEQVYLILLIVSMVVAFAVGYGVVVTAGLVSAGLVFLAGCGVGAGVVGIGIAMRKELARQDETRTTIPARAMRQRSPRPPRGGGRRPAGKAERGGERAKRPGGAPRAKGKVKWFDETKGFGFITVDDGEQDYFVHRSSIKSGTGLVEGKRVEFEIVKDDKGRMAAGNVRTLGD
jgi:cold shock CspA family protein